MFNDLVQPLDIELGVEVLLEVEVVHGVHQVVHRVLQDSIQKGWVSRFRLLEPISDPTLGEKTGSGSDLI